MKIVKILAVLALVYVGIVVLFESLLGYFQPQSEDTLVLVTQDEKGEHPRVLSAIATERGLYIAVNHWPRAWYHRAQVNPSVSVTLAGETGDYTAVPVEDGSDEFRFVEGERPLSPVFRVLTGFPPRHFLRLDPAP